MFRQNAIKQAVQMGSSSDKLSRLARKASRSLRHMCEQRLQCSSLIKSADIQSLIAAEGACFASE
jgi:hypothetical protein